MPLPDEHRQRGVYVIDGSVTVAGTGQSAVAAGQLVLFEPERSLRLTRDAATHSSAGGAPLVHRGTSGELRIILVERIERQGASGRTGIGRWWRAMRNSYRFPPP